MGEIMALDAATIRFLKQLTEGGGKPLHESTPDEARVYLSGLAELAGPAPEMQRVEDRTIDGPDARAQGNQAHVRRRRAHQSPHRSG